MTAVHHNAAAGETLTVHPHGGEILRADLVIEPRHHAPPAHVHPHTAERFTVLHGAIRIRVGRERRLLRQGESQLVPPGVTHAYTGLPGVRAHVRIELDPPGRMADFFTDIYGIADDQRHARTGEPRLGAAAAVLRRYPDDIAVPGVPSLLLAVLNRWSR